MPTLAELRCQVRHTLMAVAGLERPEQVPEPVLRGHCALEELMLLEEACRQLQGAAHARGLRGAASDAWCVARLNTEFIGHARRRGTRVTRPR
jgi:hypothetical protein